MAKPDFKTTIKPQVQKQLDELVSQFKTSVENLVINKKSGLGFFARFVYQLSKGAIKAYNLGLSATTGKKSYKGAILTAINTIKSQLPFAKKFSQAIKDGKQSQDTLIRRAGMYASQIKAAFQKGILAGTPATTKIWWVLHPAEHCKDCIQLAANSPYTPQSLPTVPGAGNTICLSNCKCTLSIRKT